jgi:Domain of unknown function (DUF427)
VPDPRRARRPPARRDHPCDRARGGAHPDPLLPAARGRADGLLEASETTSHCPFKGDATYFSAPGAKDAFWVYEAPDKPDAEPVEGLLAPWPGRVTVTVDGEAMSW